MRILVLFFIIYGSSLFASIGHITTLSGKVTLDRNNISINAVLGSKIEKKDIIKTGKNSKVKIKLNDNTLITVGKNSALNIESYIYDTKNPENSKTQLNFFKGSFKTITGNIGKINPSRFILKTKSASIGIRGTEIIGDQNRVACTSGVIEVTSFGVTYVVDNGNIIDTFDDKTPSIPRKIKLNELSELKGKLEVANKTGTITFKTKESSKQNGTTKANAKSGTVTLNGDGTIDYTPKSGFKGKDTIVLTTVNGNEVMTEIVTIFIPDDLNLGIEFNLESIIVTSFDDFSLDGFENVYPNSEDFVGKSQENLVSSTLDDKNSTDTNEETINELDDSPTEKIEASLELSSVTISTAENSDTITGELVTRTTDIENPLLTYSTSDEIAGFVLNEDGSYSFDPTDDSYDSLNTDDNNTLTIAVKVTDESGLSDESNILINLTGVSDAPIAQDDISLSTTEGSTSLSGSITATDVDNGSILKYSTSNEIAGFVLNEDGSYSFDPTDDSYSSLKNGETQNLTIEVTVKDENDLSDTLFITIIVSGISDIVELSGKGLEFAEGINEEYVVSASYDTKIEVDKDTNTVNFYTNDNLVGTLNHEFTNDSTYTGYSVIGTIDSIGQNDDYYEITSDNLGEFIVGSALVKSVDQNIGDLFYTGIKTNMNLLESGKIYKYDSFKILYSSTGEYSYVGFNPSSFNYYLNTTTKSLLLKNQDFIYNSGQYFNTGKVNEDSSFETIYNHYNNPSIAEGKLYGSNAQGIGLYEHNISEPTETTIATFYKDEASTKDIINSGVGTMSGYLSGKYDSGLNDYISSNDFEIVIDKNTGTISGDASFLLNSGNSITDGTVEAETLRLNLNGTVDSLTSYYISDDMFGSFLSSVKNNDAENTVNNGGWFVSIPDQINDDGTYSENIDNESSWGYWNAAYTYNGEAEGISSSSYSTWVAGVETNPAVVQAYINDNSSASFRGNMIGAIDNDGSISPIVLNSNNFINLNFDFGSGYGPNGTYGFESTADTSFRGAISGNTLSTSGFNSSLTVAGAESQGILEGSYYGTDTIKSVGGNFMIENYGEGIKAFGSFKADLNE